MADGHRRMPLQEQTRDWSSDDLTAPYDAGVRAGDFNLVSIQQFNDSGWSARNESRPAHREVTYVRRMKGIHIFGWIDSFNYFRVVDLFRKRKLNQNPVNL